MNLGRICITAVTTLALTGAVAAPIAQADWSAPTASSSATGVVNCRGNVVTQPKNIVLTCADGGIIVHNIRWTDWKRTTASGRGTLVWNTCLPKSCAAGIVETFRSQVTLSRVVTKAHHQVFSQMHLTFPAGGPAGLDAGRYTLHNPIR